MTEENDNEAFLSKKFSKEEHDPKMTVSFGPGAFNQVEQKISSTSPTNLLAFKSQ